MRAKEFTPRMATGQQVLDYVNKTHHEPLVPDLEQAVLRHPRWQLTTVSLSDLNIPDQTYDDNEDYEPPEDPYGRVMDVDSEHAGEYSANVVDQLPIVVDDQGFIIDGNHRAWAAAELLNRDSIRAWVPVKSTVAEGRGVKQEIEEFLDSLSPDDVGVEEFPGYRVHYEGFTDDCKSSSDYQRNPTRVYKQVYQDFIDREGGKKPAKSGMVGDEEYPILYSVFKVPQSKTIDTAEKAYNIAYKKKQPWPRGSREETLIRSDWQLSGLYDQYVLKQGVAENFADGKVRGKSRPGRVKRAGASCKGSVSDLRARAKKYGGERGRMYHWCANMKGGKKK